ncbi:MFS transporter [Deinococcus aetherius]|uniref:MFS transporter n=1 Tax=Deinococcus aetherius TaxID=200252 RepID=A0ABM8ACU5_9DEIO|nr:MFS transporter [Deinococcus aetherius]BDP41612.1 MFS transporter [Deinococcus aetherius]
MTLARLLGPHAGAVLRPPFLPYWLGQSVSALGDRMTAVALPAVVLSLGGGASDLARLAAWSTGAQLALLLIGGVLVDRLPRRAVLLAMDGLRAVLLGVTAWFLAQGQVSITALVALSAALGACSALFYPATASILPELVDDAQLVPANALRNLSNQLSGVIGPALGGMLVALGGASFALGMDALSFVVGALGLYLMRPRPRRLQEVAAQPLWREALEGFRIILASTWLWLTIGLFALVNIFFGGLNVVVLPLYAREVLGGAPDLGWLYTAQALGAVVAALVLGRLGSVRRRGIVAYTAVVGQGSAVALLALAGSLLPAMLALFVSGACVTLFSVLWEATLQERVPNEALGRVASVDMLGSIALLPLGFVVLGQAVEVLGVTGSALACGSIITLLALLGLSTRAVRGLE